MTRKQSGSGAGRLPRVYEGEAVLGPLLQASGSTLSVADVKEQIARALADKRSPGELFPTFFDGEPRFPSPDVALRLYANLFGLWERLEAGAPAEPRAAKEEPAEREPAPAPKPPGPGPLSDAFVEAAWRYLDDLPARERDRLRHRYENTQPELTEYLQVNAAESAAAFDTLDGLVFEIWAMFDLARGGQRIRAITMKELAAAETAPMGAEPAVERYVEDVIAEAAADEEEPLGDAEAESVRRIGRAAIAAVAQVQPRV